jgi:hypothetical protein
VIPPNKYIRQVYLELSVHFDSENHEYFDWIYLKHIMMPYYFLQITDLNEQNPWATLARNLIYNKKILRSDYFGKSAPVPTFNTSAALRRLLNDRS